MDVIQRLSSTKPLAKSTIEEYKRKYKKALFLGIYYKQTEDEIINKLAGLDELMNNRLAYLNVCIVLKTASDMSTDKLKKYRSDLIEINKTMPTHTNENNRKKGLPSMEDIKGHINELYTKKKYKKYIINYLLFNVSCRNKDLFLNIVRNNPKNEKDNFLVIKDNSIEFIRNNYKTFKTYGQKVTIFNDPKFISVCKEFLGSFKSKNLINDHNNIASEVVASTYKKIGQGRMNKIIMTDTDKSKLLKLSDSRGTSVRVLLESYDINREF